MEATQFCCFIIIALTGVAVTLAAKWTYTGESGPLYWHELFPQDCSGKYQSPIDIRPEETIYNQDLKNFAIWYDPPKPDSKMYIINNGHTVQVNLEGDFYVTNAGLPNVYKAIQFHFHWGHKAHHGSEHLIDGKASPIELHLVTYNHELYSDIAQAVTQKGGLAVLGVLYEISKEDNPVLATLIEHLQHVRDPVDHHTQNLPLMPLREFLPKDTTRYYRYNGSLTTPGCFESVIWTVFDEMQTISHKQLKEFTKILQLKHKRTNGNKAEESRHRRSLTKDEQEKERRASNVLDELGIRGNKFEEAILKSQFLGDNMMADMPEQDVVISIQDPSPKGHQPTLDEERAAKIDLAIDEQAGAPSNTKVRAEGHLSKQAKKVTEAESIYIQEAIVNNFRPVQPLNDRIVYRSFKLREIVPSEEDGIAQSRKSGRDPSCDPGNSVGHHILSTTTIVTVFVISFMFI